CWAANCIVADIRPGEHVAATLHVDVPPAADLRRISTITVKTIAVQRGCSMHLTDRRPRLSSFIVFSVCVAAGVATATASVQALANQDGPPRRAGETSTTLADGRVLIAGGDENGTGEIYDPATGQTTPLAARLNVARAYHRAVLL